MHRYLLPWLRENEPWHTYLFRLQKVRAEKSKSAKGS